MVDQRGSTNLRFGYKKSFLKRKSVKVIQAHRNTHKIPRDREKERETYEGLWPGLCI